MCVGTEGALVIGIGSFITYNYSTGSFRFRVSKLRVPLRVPLKGLLGSLGPRAGNSGIGCAALPLRRGKLRPAIARNLLPVCVHGSERPLRMDG